MHKQSCQKSMQIKEERKNHCIEVLGMNGLSAAYIKRFFGHIGQVDNIKKLEDKVIVVFRYARSVPKAHRYNGQVVDKEPIRIRNISISGSRDEEPENKTISLEVLQEHKNIAAQIKYGPLNLPYHWLIFERLLGNFQDDGLRWLIFQLFACKLSQILNLYLYGSNERSKYSEYVLKEIILIHNREKKVTANGQNMSTRKMQFNYSTPHDFQYETTYEAWNYHVENRIRHRLVALKREGEGLKLFYLYMLFYKNAIKIEQGAQILSDAEPPHKNEEKILRITLKSINQERNELCIEDWLPQCNSRSEYRSIDIENPSREIEIFSDSCFHEGPSSATVFQLFRDQFDGCVDNSFCVDIFHNFRPFFAPNYLLIKHSNSRKNQYIRLSFQLRILNCPSEIFFENTYSKFWTLSEPTEFPHLRFQTDSQMRQISEITMQKHNLVFGERENHEKIKYSIEQYIDYYCGFDEGETDSEFLRNLAVIIVCSNPNNENMAKMEELVQFCSKSDKVRRSRAKIYLITIHNDQIFEKVKCRNYLQAKVDSMKGNMTIEMARMRAKQFLNEQAERFRLIEQPETFITNTLWELHEQTGKRNAKKNIMTQIFKIRQ